MNKTIEEIIAEGGTECKLCGQRMLRSDGCSCTEIKFKGKIYKRIPCEKERCHDCGTTIGNYHHHGCDMEICPICKEQLIGCDCDFEYMD